MFVSNFMSSSIFNRVTGSFVVAGLVGVVIMYLSKRYNSETKNCQSSDEPLNNETIEDTQENSNTLERSGASESSNTAAKLSDTTAIPSDTDELSDFSDTSDTIDRT